MGAKLQALASARPPDETLDGIGPFQAMKDPTAMPNLQPSMRSVATGLDEELLDHVGVVPGHASPNELMQAVSQVARQKLSQRWVRTQSQQADDKARRVYYLSMEFLMGRTLGNALAALDLRGEAAAAMNAHAQRLEDVADEEPDAALGNGGLGRLAACFLDSMATLGLPSFGYGIRYEYGMFAQEIKNGTQIEHPDPWLEDGTAWEFPRAAVTYPVRFGGWVEHTGTGVDARALWRPSAEVAAKAYDMVIPGHGTDKVSTLRLWKAAAPSHIDLNAFNTGDYARAASAKNEYENISWVLYPNDSTPAGRELRLRQEYFFVAASMQDLIDRHGSRNTERLANLAEKVAIHLNDTHPAISVAELMRAALRRTLEIHWAQAWAMCGKVFSYTNHTLDARSTRDVAGGADAACAAETSGNHLPHQPGVDGLRFAAQAPGRFRFSCRACRSSTNAASAACAWPTSRSSGSHMVNGVSALHSELLVQTIFKDFASSCGPSGSPT